MKTVLKTAAVIVLLALVPGASFATDIHGKCNKSCSFNIKIFTVRPYVISVTWNGSGGASGSPVVSGMDKSVDAYMGPGTYTIHAKYLDAAGTEHDPAYLPCRTQIKFSFTNHGQNCVAYNEAFVLVTLSKGR
jgi:hypothetical protein